MAVCRKFLTHRFIYQTILEQSGHVTCCPCVMPMAGRVRFGTAFAMYDNREHYLLNNKHKQT